jgi:hypothetical protein
MRYVSKKGENNMSEKNRKEIALCHTDSGRIPWEEYETLDADVRDGLPPEEYVKRLREEDNEERRVER